VIDNLPPALASTNMNLISRSLKHDQVSSVDLMEDQLCQVCNEPAAGFHFGAFTCEGCKSFFGRTCNNQSVIGECKNNYRCVVDKKNRTSCKACRLRKCLMVGMSKSGSRYGRRSNWFKIHCLMQKNATKKPSVSPIKPSIPSSQTSASVGDLPGLRLTSSRSPSPLASSGSSSGSWSPPPRHMPDLPLLQLASLYRYHSVLAGYDLLLQRRAMFDKLSSHIGSGICLAGEAPDYPIDLRRK